MECFIVRPDDVFPDQQLLILRDDEAHHATRSLRLRIGEALMATDLEGTCYQAELSSIHEEKKGTIAECSIINVLPEYHESRRKLILAQAILQQPSRFEEIVEKATELGVSAFIPLLTERTEKKQINRERLQRILREATKQVSRARKPLLDEPKKLTDVIAATIADQTLILLHEGTSVDASLSSTLSSVTGDVVLLVGPEGGFTEDEVSAAQSRGALVASLGSRRLRAETAAIAAVSLVALS